MALTRDGRARRAHYLPLAHGRRGSPRPQGPPDGATPHAAPRRDDQAARARTLPRRTGRLHPPVGPDRPQRRPLLRERLARTRNLGERRAQGPRALGTTSKSLIFAEML